MLDVFFSFFIPFRLAESPALLLLRQWLLLTGYHYDAITSLKIIINVVFMTRHALQLQSSNIGTATLQHISSLQQQDGPQDCRKVTPHSDKPSYSLRWQCQLPFVMTNAEPIYSHASEVPQGLLGP